mgnify:CR=1 FL=1
MGDKLLPSGPGPALSEANLIGDTLPLIMTKIRVPRRRHDLLPRRRLSNLIHANLDRKLILISAPAGYGKTSLLTDFAHDTDLPVCWYTLDSFDRDLHIFLEYLIAAIALRFPAFGKRSRAILREVTDPSRNLYPIVATLVQEIYDAIPEYFVLILDDHHTVEDQEPINEFLDLLVTYVDENCHLIIASRTLPALPNLALLVARRQATGLSIDELRFTPQEIQALAQQNYGLELTQEQASRLAEQTGGWITGLLLTAAPRWERAQREVPIHGRINVRLYDYLLQQVLDQQSPLLRDFLLASSVLDELSPELCSAVLEVDRPIDLMEQLRTRNLFIIEFEGHDNRLRYHDMFREFLQASLGRQDEARFRQLTRRAAATYADRGEWERAVSRYLALQDYDRVAAIIKQTATSMHETGRWDTLAHWIDALPGEIRSATPRFLLQRGKIHTERGEHASALACYDQAERAFAAAGDDAGAASALALKAYVLRFQGRYAEAVAHCQEALIRIGGATAQEQATMALAHKNVGLCRLRMGGLAEGQEALQQALRLYEKLDDPYDMSSVHHDLGLACELAGDLKGAVDHYQAALQGWQRLGNLSPWANTLNGLGVVYYLQGRYNEALHTLTQALAKVRQAGDWRVEALVWASLGDLHRDLGAYEQARQAYTEGMEAATRAGGGFMATYAADALGNTYRLQGDLAQARRRLLEAMKIAEEHSSAYETGMCHASLGILAGEEGDLAAARRHLNQAVELFKSGGFRRDLARACLHRAQAAFLAGDRQDALSDLEWTLTLADQLGFDQFLVVDGQRLRPLLRYAAEQGVGRGALPRLLERIDVHQSRLSERPEPVVQAEPQSILKIYALGQAAVELNGEPVQWAATQSRDLFFCLLQHHQGLRREELAAIFWPDHAPHKLDGIFRSTLYRLRRALFRESVIFEDGLYHFNRESDYWFDIEAFEALLDQADQEKSPENTIALLEGALGLYRGDYLEGIYADWSALERQRLQGRHLAVLETLAELYGSGGDLQRAIELYQRLLTEDPYQETAYQRLMRFYHRLGDRAAAIRQYQTCAEVLREDLGLSPMPETEALYLQIIG